MQSGPSPPPPPPPPPALRVRSSRCSLPCELSGTATTGLWDGLLRLRIASSPLRRSRSCTAVKVGDATAAAATAAAAAAAADDDDDDDDADDDEEEDESQ